MPYLTVGNPQSITVRAGNHYTSCRRELTQFKTASTRPSKTVTVGALRICKRLDFEMEVVERVRHARQVHAGERQLQWIASVEKLDGDRKDQPERSMHLTS